MMRKNALSVTVSTAVMGVFGAFLRWLQNRMIFEPDTGLATPGAPISIVCLVYAALAAAAMLAIVLFWLRPFRAADSPAAVVRARTVLPMLLGWVLFVGFSCAGLWLMFTSAEASMPRLRRIFGACAVLAGACFPFLTTRTEDALHPLGKLSVSYLSLFYCFWLVYSYVTNAQNPVLWDYAPEIVALAGVTMSFYYVAGWYFRAGHLRRSLFFTQLGAFFCICILPDARSRSALVLLAGTVAVLLLLEYVLIENLLEAPREDAEGTGAAGANANK